MTPTHEVRFSREEEKILAGGVPSVEVTPYAPDVPVEFALLSEGRAQRWFGISTRAKASARVDRGVPVERDHRVEVTASDRGDSLGTVWLVAEVLPDGADHYLLALVPEDVAAQPAEPDAPQP